MNLPAELLREITREEVNELPIRRYEGTTRLVVSPQDLEQASAALLSEPVVGFDTETRPAFRPGESYAPALVQAATADAVYLLPLRDRATHPLVARLLASEALKIGIGLADDLKGLRKLFDFEPKAILDLGDVARGRGLRKTGVRTLAALFLGFRIPKGTKTSNWAAQRLSPQQVTYAATDAWACRELYLKFKELGLL